MDSDSARERRQSTRKPVHRRALFSGGDGALLMGELADAGKDGLCIRTATPARVGSELDIEVHSASGAWTDGLRLRGRVVYTAREGDDGIMGVRLLPDRNRPNSESFKLEPRPRTREIDWTPVNRSPVSTPRPPRRLWRWTIPPTVLAVLLLLFFLRVQSISTPDGARIYGLPSDSAAPVAASSAALPNALEQEAVLPAASRDARVEADAPTGTGDASSQRNASAGLKRPMRPVSPLPLEQFERVEGTLSDVRLASATRDASSASPGVEAAPALDEVPWIYAQSSTEGAQAALVPEEAWLAMPDNADKGEDSEVSIIVEKSRHRLVLFRNGTPLRTFEVGLGRNDSTPEGNFRIAVKATNPAWKHKGRVIPGGSPENRIGKRWMGLANEDVLTSYGIHPAKNTRAIGGNTSFGCIQMYPADADALFRFCPLGTRVTIRA